MPVFEDDDVQIEEEDEFFLFMSPVSVAPVSGAVAAVTVAAIARDPNDTPRARRIIETIKQNLNRIDDRVDAVQSALVSGSTGTVTFDTPGVNYWTCPAGITSIVAEVWGAGGGANMVYGGAGGGYASGPVLVTPGSIYAAYVPSPDSQKNSSFVGDSESVKASSAYFTEKGEGLLGTILHKGGRGGVADTAGYGGNGGGGAGGLSSDGANGVASSGASGSAGGAGGGLGSGAGGAGGDFGSAGGSNGLAAGGGGGGTGSINFPAGNGSVGKVVLSWTTNPAIPDGSYGEITALADFLTIITDAVTTAKILNGAVTEAKQTLANNTTHDVSTGIHGYVPAGPGDATKFLSGSPGWALVKDSDLSTSDVTTNNASASKHGFLPKLAGFNDVLIGGFWATHGTIILEDHQTSGTHGGTFTAGAWQTRDLNTKVIDTNGDCTLASNQFTLVAGTYEIEASAPAVFVNQHQIRMLNITDSLVQGLGESQYADTTNQVANHSRLFTRVVIGSSKVFEIQHQCALTVATFGFGGACSFGTEVYTRVVIHRVA